MRRREFLGAAAAAGGAVLSGCSALQSTEEQAFGEYNTWAKVSDPAYFGDLSENDAHEASVQAFAVAAEGLLEQYEHVVIASEGAVPGAGEFLFDVDVYSPDDYTAERVGSAAAAPSNGYFDTDEMDDLMTGIVHAAADERGGTGLAEDVKTLHHTYEF